MCCASSSSRRSLRASRPPSGERSLSEALLQLLIGLHARVPLQRIDCVWLFPPRQLRGRESGLAVLALYPAAGEAADRRQLLTLRYEAERRRGTLHLREELVEQGSASAERIERVVSGVLRRLGDALEAPRIVRIGGNAERWEQLLQEVAAAAVPLAPGA